MTREPWHRSDPFHRWSKFQTDGFKTYLRSIRDSEHDESPTAHRDMCSPFMASVWLRRSRFEEMRHDANVNWMFRARRVHTVQS